MENTEKTLRHYIAVLETQRESLEQQVKNLEETNDFLRKENNSLIFDKSKLVDKNIELEEEVDNLKKEREGLCKKAWKAAHDYYFDLWGKQKVIIKPNFEEWKKINL